MPSGKSDALSDFPQDLPDGRVSTKKNEPPNANRYTLAHLRSCQSQASFKGCHILRLLDRSSPFSSLASSLRNPAPSLMSKVFGFKNPWIRFSKTIGCIVVINMGGTP